MVETNVVLTLLQTISIMVGIGYYILNIQNNQKNQELSLIAQQQALETRQTALFMDLYNVYRDHSFRTLYMEITTEWNWVDYEDWQRKYSPDGNMKHYTKYMSVMSYFEGIGVLVKRGLIDISLVYDLLELPLKIVWSKFETVVLDSRKHLDMAHLWNDVEYLYNELMKYIEEHQENVT